MVRVMRTWCSSSKPWYSQVHHPQRNRLIREGSRAPMIRAATMGVTVRETQREKIVAYTMVMA